MGLSVNYATTAGESLANVASGINAALAGAGISLSAQVLNGQQLELTSSDFGSAAGFSVTSDNTGAGTTGLAGRHRRDRGIVQRYRRGRDHQRGGGHRVGTVPERSGHGSRPWPGSRCRSR